MYLMNEGEELTEAESTDVFFKITKLFQSNDVNLRRMVYLILKELNVKDTEVFIVVSSLQRDISGNVDLFRGNAIRVLARILDPSTF
jgi:coatomer protein complex subunit gamma